MLAHSFVRIYNSEEGIRLINLLSLPMLFEFFYIISDAIMGEISYFPADTQVMIFVRFIYLTVFGFVIWWKFNKLRAKMSE